MLSKLIGYEMKAFGRILLPIYGAIVVAAILMGIDMRFSWAANHLGGEVLPIILGVLVAAVFIVTILLSVIRFYNNLLGREGYLMFSLPVGTGNLIWAKVISSVIWCVLCWVIAVLSVLPILAAPDIQDEWNASGGSFWIEIMKDLAPYKWNILLGIVLVIALAVLFIVRIYAAVSIGHLWTEHRILGALLAFIGLNVVKTIVRISSGTSLSSGWLREASTGIRFTAGYEGLLLLITAAGIALYSVVTWLILDRKLNLE